MKFSITLLFLVLYGFCQAQISEGGMPISYKLEAILNNNAIEKVKMPAFNAAEMIAEDVKKRANGDKKERFGKNFTVEYNIQNSGTWEVLSSGDKLWRLHITSAGAFSINLMFSKFNLQPGAKLFIYNTDYSHVIGGFTYQNNKPWNTFATAPIKGESVIVELLQPANALANSELEIGRVTHAYKNLFSIDKQYGDSGPCNINSICPLGDNYRKQIRSVARIIANGNDHCTGTLMNNANYDSIPYFLSANHCGTNAQNWVFVFNWESPSCSPTQNASLSQSITGATLKANSSASDFTLFELSARPPINYNVFYSGWDKSDIIPTSTTTIHHPSGDIKKISYDADAAVKDGYNGSAADDHWKILDWDQGTTEGGSSGSGLFDVNGRVIGQLHGGFASCGNNSEDWYGRLAKSWNNGSASNSLQPWLDPSNSLAVLDGYPNVVFNEDAELLEIKTDEDLCNVEKTKFEVLIRNNGANTINTLTIEYTVNGSAPISYAYAGALQSNQTDLVFIDSLQLNNGVNTYTVELKNPNGMSDQNTINDSKTKEVYAVVDGKILSFNLMLDDYGSEISWELLDSVTNSQLYSGGPYVNTSGGQNLSIPFCLGDGCFVFKIYDSFGDGLNGSQFTGDDGDYNITDQSGFVYAEMGSNPNFGNQKMDNFCVVINSIEENKRDKSILKVFPNPSKDYVNVRFNNGSENIVYVRIYDVSGKEVIALQPQNGAVSALYVGTLDNGIYLISVTTLEGEYISKFIKN